MYVTFMIEKKTKKQKGGYVNRPIKTKNLQNAIYSLFDKQNNNNSNDVDFIPASKTKHIK